MASSGIALAAPVNGSTPPPAELLGADEEAPPTAEVLLASLLVDVAPKVLVAPEVVVVALAPLRHEHCRSPEDRYRRVKTRNYPTMRPYPIKPKERADDQERYIHGATRLSCLKAAIAD